MKLIDENDKKASLPNLAIILGIVGGLLLMFGGLIKDVHEVYIQNRPLGIYRTSDDLPLALIRMLKG